MANILGINLSELRTELLIKKIIDFLSDQQQHYLVTPNPEIILKAGKDEELFYILNQADLAPADGFGLKIAGLLSGYNLPRITGADLTLELLKIAQQKKLKTLILNWENGLSKKTEIARALIKKFPGLNFKILEISRNKILDPELINEINNFSPNLMFNTLGSPYQEKLIYHNLKELPSIKVALGVGGAFDFISGKAQRAPKIIRKLGLEWCWRLFKEPRRFKRIYQATLVFSAKFLYINLINRWLYRPNVALILYKDEAKQKKILVVKRRDNEQWQLPQGGRDGESIKIAGKRELQEELGIKKTDLISKGIFKNIYRYDFNSESGQMVYQSKISKRYRYSGYKGQKQSLYIAKFRGTDNEIKINFWDHVEWKWVPYEELVTAVHEIRQTGAKIFLEKFKSLKL